MELIKIQSKLKAPKNQMNKFGGYKYRNCEDILEALKPLLEETKTFINIKDEIVLIGNRYYVKATASLFNSENKLVADSNAFAREDETKKGMDLSQLTGSTSSYARKYALNGLFAIDDTKDSDYLNTPGKSEINEPKVLDFEEFKQALLDCSSFNELKSLWSDNYKNFTNDKEIKELEMIKNNKKIKLSQADDSQLMANLVNKK